MILRFQLSLEIPEDLEPAEVEALRQFLEDLVTDNLDDQPTDVDDLSVYEL